MNINQAFPSRFIKADDVARPVQVQIAGVTVENVGTDDKPQNKPVLHFLYQGRQAEKGMVLNKTNAETIAMDLGSETDAWTGHTVELFKARVQGPNGIVDAVRLRLIFPNSAPAASPFAPAAAPLPPYPPVPLSPGGNIPPSSAFKQPMPAGGPFGPEPPVATPNAYGAKPTIDDDIPF